MSGIEIAIEHIVPLIGSGRPDLAATEAASLRARAPGSAEAARLHGIALLQANRVAEAIAALREAATLAPSAVEVLCNLGSALLAQGDAAAATATLERAATLAPAHPAVLNGLGNARRASGDESGARDAYRAATAAAPDHAGIRCNLAASELALGDPVAAEASARAAQSLDARHPEAWLLLGHALAAQRRLQEAAHAYESGAHLHPADARFPYHAGLVAEQAGHLAKAADAHATAFRLDPTLDHALGQLVFLRRQLCLWEGLDALSRRLRERAAAGARGISPFAFLAEPASAAEQLRCATTEAQAIARATEPARKRMAFRPMAAPDTLRVGLVANGLREHPTASLIVAFVEAMRDQPVELHLFSTAPDDGGPHARRLRAAAHWHDASNATDSALAREIHAAGMEILLDVDGYCEGAMPKALALRPAPIQVNWLAYPGTLGAPWIDYVIADRIVLPRWMHADFSEHVAWLPRCFQPSDTAREVGPAPARASLGLPDDGIVFACFNNGYKLNPASFERALAVLRAVPRSVLWLLSRSDEVDRRVRAEAVARGVSGDRIVFAPPLPPAEHLRRYRVADLFLDTGPYGAHTTASDAAWAGCPVLTVAGRTFAARVAASINHHLGLAELDAGDDAAFVVTATRLARDAGARAELRERLDARRADSGVFDMTAYAADFTALLARMAERHRNGLQPASLE